MIKDAVLFILQLTKFVLRDARDEMFTEAVKAIKENSYSFLYTGELQAVFRKLQREINERTDGTDTLVILIPEDKVNGDKLHFLPLPVGKEDGNYAFDWFTIPEERTGFAADAAEFVSELIKALNSLPVAQIPSPDEVRKMKDRYPSGTKLRIKSIRHDYAPDVDKATVDFIDDAGQVHVKEFKMAVIPGIDEFEVTG